MCLDSPRAAALSEALRARGIPAWNGHGRLRFSLHGYNAAGEVDRVVAAMRDPWRG